MRVTLSKLASGFLLALLTVLLLAPSSEAYAQSATRSFQMTLWACCGPTPTSADTDIASFSDGQPQPPGRSIVLVLDWQTALSTRGYDWSRIVAVEVDEPYNSLNKVSCFSQGAVDTAASIDQLLAARAAELKSLAPFARFWVNFTGDQIGWIAVSSCPYSLNEPYIDVISLDSYYQPFYQLQFYYDWLAANPATPQQQLALIPGTFYRKGTDSPSAQASLLQGYFDYANNANQSCNLSRGSRGVTGSFDGCPVWIVMGWLSGNYMDGNTLYVGELDPSSAPIAAAWRQEVALPLRPGLAHQLSRAQIVGALLPQWAE